MNRRAAGTFRALSIFNYRVWTAGALVSNIGTWNCCFPAAASIDSRRRWSRAKRSQRELPLF